MNDAEFKSLLDDIRALTREQVMVFNDPEVLAEILADLSTPEQKMDFILTKNSVLFGGLNEYVKDFVAKTRANIPKLPEGPGKIAAKQGQRAMAEHMLTQEGLTEVNKVELQSLLGKELAAAAAGGKSTRRRRARSTRRVKRGIVNT